MTMTAEGFVVNVRSVSCLSLCSSNEQIHCANCKRRAPVPVYLRVKRQTTMFPDRSNRINSESQRQFVDGNNVNNDDNREFLSSGVSIAILHGDNVLYRHDFGNHKPDSAMCIYSTKIVTSIACLPLVTRGRLSLNLSLSTFHPLTTIAVMVMVVVMVMVMFSSPPLLYCSVHIHILRFITQYCSNYCNNSNKIV